MNVIDTKTEFFMAGHALIERNNEYLITRRSKSNTYKPLKWDIPGGIVKPGETLENAIHREVKEETQLEIEIGSIIYIYANRDQLPVRQTFQAVYSCKYSFGEIRLNPSEHDTFLWLNYKDISNLDLIDFLRELIKSYQPTQNCNPL
jgi:8-oxo-dGTP diphosphatase